MSGALALVEQFVAGYPDEVARRLERLGPGESALVVGELSSEAAAGVLRRMAPLVAASTLVALPRDVVAGVLASLPLDAMVSLLRRIDADEVARLLNMLPGARSRTARALLMHAPDTAGGVMNPHVAAVPLAATIGDARALVEAHPVSAGDGIFTLGPSQDLTGVVEVADLIGADPAAPLARLARDTASIPAAAPLKAVFAHHGWRDRDALPVVSADHRLVGVLRYRHVRDLLAQDEPGSGEHGVQTVIALGEIYWLGLCGLLEGIAAAARDSEAQGARS